MPIGLRVDHIGYITKDLNKSLETFIALDWIITEKFEDPVQESSIVFIKKDNYYVELIQFKKKSKFVGDFLNGNSTHLSHIAYIVTDIDRTIKNLKELVRITKSTPKEKSVAFKNKLSIFLMTSVGLIELIEK